MVGFQLCNEDDDFSKSTSDLNTFAIHNMHVSYHNCVTCEYSQYFTVFHSESERDIQTCIKWEEKIQNGGYHLSQWAVSVLICMYKSDIAGFL